MVLHLQETVHVAMLRPQSYSNRQAHVELAARCPVRRVVDRGQFERSRDETKSRLPSMQHAPFPDETVS